MLIKEALLFSKPAVADVMFFLLEQKEPKIQECRIASGRHSALRAWVVTFVSALQTALHFAYLFSYCHSDGRRNLII